MKFEKKINKCLCCILASCIYLPITLISLTLNAQNFSPSENDPYYYYNNFKDTYFQNAETSLFYLHQLSQKEEWRRTLLPELIHETFTQYFIEYASKNNQGSTNNRNAKKFSTACEVLNRMANDTCLVLSANATPLQYWVNALLNKQDETYITSLVNDFIDTQLPAKDLYKYKTSRYALLIYQIISQESDLSDLSETLLTAINNRLQERIYEEKENKHIKEDRRAYYRFLYAYCNYLEGEKLTEDNYITKAAPYFKTAFEYSPDYIDMMNQSGFMNEMEIFGLKDVNFFRSQYINFLTTYSYEEETILDVYLAMALINPIKYKKMLQDYYTENFSSAKSFTEYWFESINQHAKDLPAKLATESKDNNIKSFIEQGQNKWIFIDFWGTWCGPCLREQPEIENFYHDTIQKNKDKIVMLTINYNDTQEQVEQHMDKNKYTFPVEMGTIREIKIFNIKNWPTKILITPQRKYVEIPIGADWINFVSKYVELQR